ncbi:MULTISPECIES: carbohydrate kinase family protein [unclassified Leifsonia]|uniref:carbohydrate kinase family protein n=1 Tax=unclassified Leifsonia TaxID=2663824 RepID=UPI0006FDCE21|nr:MULTISPECIES: sugar kinase [unclassified Leifsonia]KQX08147.1 carbohydrate kinase [Leifsonia sp. Root1293]KRA12428.1 carbohydrate kinase [Leifsonia sp. Root60]
MTGVLVVGDANPDLILTGDTVPRFGQAEQLLDGADLVVGGSASIVACGLATLGVSTALIAAVGDDDFGRFMTDHLARLGVDTSAIVVDPSTPTGLSVILATSGDRSILTLPGTIPTLTAQAVLAAVDRLQPQHVHIASFFLQPMLAAGLPALFATVKERGITISLDTNWDPAERWAGLDEVLPLVDVFLPNREEVLAIARVTTDAAPDVSPDTAAAALAALGPRVVVKSGADGGVSVAADGRIVRAPGLVIDVVDTTGAGDSFDAGYLAALVAGVASEEERVRWAAVAGSLSTRGAGGTGFQATASELASHLASAAR